MSNNVANIVNSDYLENIKQDIKWQWSINETQFIDSLIDCINDSKDKDNNNNK